MTRDRIIDIRQAAIYMGCSPAFILKLKRGGWIKSAEELQNRKDIKRHEQTYYLWTIDMLCRDIAWGLSLFDIAAVRLRKDETPGAIAKASGIPLRVIMVILSNEFAELELLIAEYAYRRHENANLFSMSQIVNREIARKQGRSCRGSSTQAKILPGLASKPPGRRGKTSAGRKADPLKVRDRKPVRVVKQCLDETPPEDI